MKIQNYLLKVEEAEVANTEEVVDSVVEKIAEMEAEAVEDAPDVTEEE